MLLEEPEVHPRLGGLMTSMDVWTLQALRTSQERMRFNITTGASIR